MIPLPSLAAVRIGALVAVIVLAGVGGWTVRGWRADAEISKLRTGIAEGVASAASEARRIERIEQEAINDALRKQNEKLAGINGRLAADIDRLRKRPERPSGVSEAPRVDCTGANGAELGGSHAIFLARFAALAARYDAALEACYSTIDGSR